MVNNLKLAVVLTSTGEKYTKMRAARATRSFFPLLTKNVTAFWRCHCRNRRRFLNSLIAKIYDDDVDENATKQ